MDADVRMVWKLLDFRLAERSLEVGASRRYPCTPREEAEEGGVEEEEEVDAGFSPCPCACSGPDPDPSPSPCP